MKYLLLELEKEKYWIELDDESYANRQIILDEYNQFHISCMEDCLAEGKINEIDLDANIINLTSQEFENIWQYIIQKYNTLWKETKKKYPIGSFVQGLNSYSYPQGIIIKGEDFIAIYKNDDKLFCLNKLVRYKVKSYDDINMWLIVE